MKRHQHTRVLSILLAVCMLVSLLPVGMMAGATTGESSYTYNYMKMSAFASAGSVGSSPLVKDYVTDFGLTLTGSETDKAPAIPSSGWKAGGLINGGDWEWTYSAEGLGLYWLSSAGVGSYNSIDIQVPADGIYQIDSIHSPWASGGTVKMYIAPMDTSVEDILAGDYVFVSDPVSHYAATTQDGISVTIGKAVELVAGDYTVLYYQTSESGQYFIEGLKLYNIEMVDSVSLGADEISMMVDESRKVTATVFPATASQDVTFSTDDATIADVAADGTIAAKKKGTAVITATSVEDPSVSDSVTVTVGAKEFSYDFRDRPGPGSKVDVVGYLEEDGFGVNKLYNGAFWMWTPSSPTYGYWLGNAFAPYTSAGDDTYAMMDVYVPAPGTYQISSVNSIWAGGGKMNFYIVPQADAADFLTKGTKLNNTPVDMYSSTLAGDQVMPMDNLVELNAGYYTVVYDVETINQGFYLTGLQFVDALAVKEVTLDCGSEASVMVDTTLTVNATVLPSSAENKNVVWSSDNEDVATVANGVITAKKKGTAVITATSAADSSVSASMTVTVTAKNFKYSYKKNSAVTTNVAADGWGANANYNGAYWEWTGSSGSGGFYLGNAFSYATSANDDTYAMIDVSVPVAGTYQITSIHTLWSAGGTFDLYIVPTADAANFLTAGTKLNNTPIDTLASAISWDVSVALENTVELEAGSYTLVYDAVTLKSGYYIGGVEFTGVDGEVAAESISFDKTGLQFVTVDGSMTIGATIAPAAATNKNIVWTSSDDSIASVADGVVTAHKAGIVTITATAADGNGATAALRVLVTKSADADYNYKIRESMATVSSNFMVPSETDGGFSTGYEASQTANVGSAPWMYDSGTKKLSYSASTVAGYGVFVDYGTPGDYARLKIQVGDDGVYHMVLNHDMWYGSSGAFDVYLAPVAAKDPVASEYLIYGWTPVSGIATALRTDVYVGEADIPQGEYYLTIMFKAPSTSKLIGISDFRLYKSGEIGIYTTEGASIRAESAEKKQGLRFYSTISKAVYDVDALEFGMILLPTEDLNGNPDNLKLGYSANGHTVAKSVAYNRYEDTDEKTVFTSVLINIPPSAYKTAVSARAYVILEDGSVVYSDTVTSRSIYEVAEKILLDQTASADEIAAAQSVVDNAQ